MSLRTRRSFRALLIATCSTALLSSGCASLDLSGLSLGGKSAPTGQAIGPDTPTFFVEMHGATGKPRRATLPLTKATLASDVFAQMKGRPFNRYDAWIVRKTQSGEQLRLPLQWNNEKTGVVAPESNYAIHPNDRVLIVENTNTFLDDMIDEVTRPLQFMTRS